MIEIKNHKLSSAKWHANVPMGGPLAKPRFVAIHITDGGTAESSIAGWINGRAASAHTVTDRDATVHQCVPFDRVAYHAGVSSWRGLTNLNDDSIGLELSLWGALKERADGQLVSWANRAVPRDKAIMARHKFGGPATFWEAPSEGQITAICDQIAALGAAYPSLEEVIEHCDIAPLRRRDPGPAVPMDRCKAALQGRRNAKPDWQDLWQVVSASGLNVRAAPHQSGTLIATLADKEIVIAEARQDGWRRVRSQSRPTIGGWVHASYLLDVL